MNHLKIYESIINNAKYENRIKYNKSNSKYVYYENHHILPRCLNGSDDKENLVLLTAKEHFVVHKLLTHIYPKNFKILAALNLMTFINNRKYGITSRDYAYVRELYNITPIDKTTIKKLKNIKRTPEWNRKISEKLKGRKHSKETKEKISRSGIGRKHTPEAIENYKRGNKGKNIGVKHSLESCKRAGEKLKGKPAWNKNKKHCYSNKSLEKMRMSARNRKKIICEYCKKEITPNMYARWHGKKCKLRNKNG